MIANLDAVRKPSMQKDYCGGEGLLEKEEGSDPQVFELLQELSKEIFPFTGRLGRRFERMNVVRGSGDAVGWETETMSDPEARLLSGGALGCQSSGVWEESRLDRGWSISICPSQRGQHFSGSFVREKVDLRRL